MKRIIREVGLIFIILSMVIEKMVEKEAQDLMIAPYGKDKQGRPFLPNPTQQKVLDWVDRVRAGKHPLGADGKKRLPVLYLQGAIRAGKTRGFLAPVIECLNEIEKLRVLWARQDFADLRLSAMETFFEVMPGELISSRNVQEKRYGVGGNGAQIFFQGFKDLAGLGSQEYAIIVITEAHEISHSAYLTAKNRCMQSNMPNMLLLEGNPPNEGHWLDNLTKQGKDEYDPDVETWELSIWENYKNLPEGYRNSLLSLPRSWRLKYLEGKTGFIADGKPFYDGFQENLHKRALKYIKGKVIYRGIDFGFHHPGIVYCQLDANDRFMILAEILGNELTIDKFADQFIAFENTYFPGVKFETYYDPAGEQVTDKSEKTSVEILADKKITGRCKQSTYRERKELVERKLTTLIGGIPALIVDESCKIIIDGFLGGYHYPKAQGTKPVKEEPERDGYYEHLLNALEYIVVNLFTVATGDNGSDDYVSYEEKYGKPDKKERLYA